HFRLVREDYTAELKGGPNHRYRPEYLDEPHRKSVLAKKPDKAWTVKLPETKDYQEKIHEVPVPKDLKPGFYFLIASSDPGFVDKDYRVTFADVWVSKLALIMRTRWDEGNAVEGFVLDANTGEPIAGAEVQAWFRDEAAMRRQVRAWKPEITKKTDE